MAGIQDRGFFRKYSRPPAAVSPVQGAYDNFGTAVRNDDASYDDIMSKFRDVYDQAGGSAGRTFNVNLPAAPEYQSTPEYQAAIANLSGLSRTGGFSAEDIANIRERAISPIRAVYANAKRNVDRSKRLQGGYSPNYTAATAKMARESSSLMSDASTDANAEIAGRVAANKIATAGPLASLTAGEQANRNDFALRRSAFDRENALTKANFDEKMFEFPIQSKLSALSGMTGLYGTTPARSALMGNMATNTAQLQNQINNDTYGRGMKLLQLYQ